MTTKRLLVLLAVLSVTLGSVYLLPQQLGFQPLGINLALPETIGAWAGRDVAIQEKERTTLGADTEFARKGYENGFGDNILVSIVLSGQDMMTGIHRPERCLQAQGWNTGAQSRRTLQLPASEPLQVMRLRNSRILRDEQGKPFPIENICYYWFVGHSDRTASHGERVWLDARDRLLKGYNQRWALIMVSAEITKERHKFGRDERQTDALLQEFIERLAPRVHREQSAGGQLAAKR